MLFCDACKEKRGWISSLFKDNGKCAECGTIGLCNNVNANILLRIDNDKKEKELSGLQT